MMTAYHGNIFNASEIGRSLGLSGPTMRRYLDILTGTFMIRQLQPWFENITKRQVKSPKIYFRDSGLFHTLLGVNEESQISRNPKLGASWEGFALESIIRAHKLPQEECFFWAIHEQAELDLMFSINGERVGFEFKWADAPKITKSILAACETLDLKKCYLIYPGHKSYQLTETISVFGLDEYINSI
jgi:predicted AAA+ superfamily ATPase